MRFLHTADWHLGRLFHQEHLTEDQAHVLQQLIDIARDSRVDAVIVAGDVYDRAVPPPEAVKLLDDTLSELLLGMRIPVILSAGNHDSPERLSFGARLLATQGLHLFGALNHDFAPVVLHDQSGPVHFYVVPYAEPALVRQCFADADINDHESAMRAVIGAMTPNSRTSEVVIDSRLRTPDFGLAGQAPEGDDVTRPGRGVHAAATRLHDRSVLVAHAYVQGGLIGDSERPLSVGGAGLVRLSNFDPFHYVALGHLHRPQEVGDPRCRYAGALMKYSFDEIGQQRSVTIVEMDANGACRTEHIALVPPHELRRIEGTLEELLQAGERERGEPQALDYIVARLTGRYPVLDPMGRIRAAYPNILAIERVRDEVAYQERASGDRRRLDFGQLFTAFFKDVTGEEPTADEQSVFAESADQVARQDREVVA